MFPCGTLDGSQSHGWEIPSLQEELIHSLPTYEFDSFTGFSRIVMNYYLIGGLATLFLLFHSAGNFVVVIYIA